MPTRSDCLVPLGWFVAMGMYLVQACFLMKFLEEHTTTHSNLYWIGVGLYLALACAVLIVLCKSDHGYAVTDDQVWWVWRFWFLYILLYVISVGIIFAEVFDKLKNSET